MTQHNQEHSPGHGHGQTVSRQTVNRAFYWGIALNFVFTGIEFVVGYYYNSLALLADAGHNLSDVASLVISLIGMKLSQKAANLSYTYGYKKASVLASFINSILIISIVINIFIEAVERLTSSPEIVGNVIIYTALIGVIINTVSAFLFYKGQKQDINIKGAFLHLIVDAVVSVGVVISGIIINITELNIIDPIISLVIGIVILISAWGLFKESLKLTLDGVPKDIDLHEIEKLILTISGVKEVHHIHVWALSSTENALTAHISLIQNNIPLKRIMDIKHIVKKKLKTLGIQHSTIEIDSDLADCLDENC